MMPSSLDSKAMKKMNKRLVLDYIRSHPNTSRVDVAQGIGLNKATVSCMVDELLEDQFVRERGFAVSRGGRKPIKLQYDESSGYCIGIDVESQYLICGLFNLNGDRVYLHKVIRSQTDDNCLLEQIKQQVRLLLAKVRPTHHGVIGIGVATVQNAASTSILKRTSETNVTTTRLTEMIDTEFHMSSFVENHANCGALTVLKTRGRENAVFVDIGSAIGVGILNNGGLYQGDSTVATEFGHTTISVLGLKCSCGSYGCWEEYASERALLRYLKENGVKDLASTTVLGRDFIADCISMAHSDERVEGALKTIGEYIGIGLSNVIKALSPARVVVGGNLMRASEYVFPSLSTFLSIYSTRPYRKVPVEIADPLAFVTGAAELVIRSRLLDLI